jgi:RimJ/RimL family protein N-acetyltransferase
MFEEVVFRPLDRSDFPLLQQWLSEPHVDAWWHEPLDLASLELGPIVIREFLKRVVFTDRGIRTVITDIDERNIRSLRAFEKASFCATKTVQLRGEDFRRRVMRLNVPALEV